MSNNFGAFFIYPLIRKLALKLADNDVGEMEQNKALRAIWDILLL